jgi:orotidine-5'-phosphate decarboxylase
MLTVSPPDAELLEKVIFAADLPYHLLFPTVERLLPQIKHVKVGPILLNHQGLSVVEDLARHHIPNVFVDAKWHDVPHVVAESVDAAVRSRASMVTVHTAGGAEMMRAASMAAFGRIKVLGVVALTSLSESDFEEATGCTKGLDYWYGHQMDLALANGLDGLICSAREVAMLRSRYRSALLVVPGVENPWAPTTDQKRTATARRILELGASFVVAGRVISQAPTIEEGIAALLA